MTFPIAARPTIRCTYPINSGSDWKNTSSASSQTSAPSLSGSTAVWRMIRSSGSWSRRVPSRRSHVPPGVFSRYGLASSRSGVVSNIGCASRRQEVIARDSRRFNTNAS